MQFTTKTPTEFKIHNIATITISFPIGELDEITADTPMRDGKHWRAQIDVATKSIKGWPVGTPFNFTAWPVDSGSYQLLNEKGEVIAECVENYVPNHLLPGEWGEYLQLEIDEYGTITNWLKDANFKDFEPDEITD